MSYKFNPFTGTLDIVRPSTGSSGAATVNIPGLSTVVVDTTSLSAFSRLDYVLSFVKNSDSSTKSLRMIVQNSNGVVFDSVSERIGNAMDIALNVTSNLVDESLSVTNNEASSITLTMQKMTS